MQREKQPAGRTVARLTRVAVAGGAETGVAQISAARTRAIPAGSVYADPTHQDWFHHQEHMLSGGRKRFRSEGHAFIADAGSVHGSRRHDMTSGFQSLRSVTVIYAPQAPAAVQRWFDPDLWWSSLAAAFSWLSVQIVEGFALAAVVTHSEFIWALDDDPDGRNPVDRLLGWGIPSDPSSRSRAGVSRRAPLEHEVVRYRPLQDVQQIQPAVDGSVEISAAQRDAVETNLSSGSDPSSARPGWTRWTVSILTGVRSKAVQWREVNRMKTDWRAIDDRTLRDIGLSRYDVDLIVGDGHRCD